MRKKLTALMLTMALLLSAMMVPATKTQAATKTYTMRVGDKAKLIMEMNGKTISPSKITYKLSKKGIVKVSKKGVVTAKKVGKVTVKGTCSKGYTKWIIKVKKKKSVDSYAHSVNGVRYRVPKVLKLYAEQTRNGETTSIFTNSAGTRSMIVSFTGGSFSSQDFAEMEETYNAKGGTVEQNIRNAITAAGKDGSGADISMSGTKKGSVFTVHYEVTTSDGYYEDSYILFFNKDGKKVMITSTALRKSLGKALTYANVVKNSIS
ncbi:MAG: Ig-like domain-containing protein [Lachnospiraceae bacterium]|nr:Ig-like domain-containing protein [Lachnospiraceae bacterium]